MHTSTVLSASDFEYRHTGNGAAPIPFETFCPNYHELDRTAVVSPRLEDGVLHTGLAFLAQATRFYDQLRARTTNFFAYAQHFAFFDANEQGIRSGNGRLPLQHPAFGRPWSNLDVWPDSKWICSPGSVSGMLKTVWDLQINRLFWPHGFMPSDSEEQLPPYAFKMLNSTLKSVCYYNTPAPTVEIRGSQVAEKIAQQSISHLTDLGVQTDATAVYEPVERHRQISPQEFLQSMAACFETD